MEPPSLKLVLVGGPRQGETLEFRPRSTVRIGRVVRGNNLCIKDDGISSKHLLIASEYGKWTIQGLDSSNGTSLNSTPLSPFEPCVLSHNDTVKLGESTSILVQFEELDQASQSRRYPRRGGRGVAKIEPVMEDPSLKARRSEENKEVRVVEEKPVAYLESKTRGRPRKNKESDNFAPIGTEPRELRSTRGRTNGGGLVFENLEEGHRESKVWNFKPKNLPLSPLSISVPMERASLKLVLVGGPRQGETLEFRPRSTVRIGRVVRGNNLCIKDDGISSKHLLIASEYGKWTIQDLDSSNGTSLNSTPLSPFEPCVLSHNDTVKLGDSTTILVQFVELDQASQSRRYPRRGGRGVAKIEPVMENPSLKARGSEENEEVCVVEEKPVANLEEGLREADVGEGAVEDKGSLDVEKGGEELEGKVANEEAVKGDMKVGDLEKVCEADVGEGVVGDQGISDMEKDGEELDAKVANEEAVKGDVKVGDLEMECEADVGEGAVENKGILVVEKDREKLEAKAGDEEAVKGDLTVGDLEKERGEASIRNEEGTKGREQSGGGQAKFEWETATLEDWFDYMEEYCRRKIIQETEEMIEEMRRKAARVNAYIMEQKRQVVEDKVELATEKLEGIGCFSC